MITTLKPFRSKEHLHKQVSTQPYLVHIKGYLYDKEGKESEFDAAVDKIPYKGRVIVKHNGVHYCFRKTTDGSYSVE